MPALARRLATPFVGRDEEVAEVRRAYDTSVREASCRLVTIVGPPGIGKSRLAREVVRSLEPEARVVVGRCLAYGEGITYLPLAEIVREVAGADPESALTEILANVERGPIATRLIIGAIGAKGEAGSPEETAWAFRLLFETLALSKPLVVVVDDIHWAEPTLLDLLDYVLGFSSGAPILLLCLARGDLFEARPSWAAPRAETALVLLSPLSHEESGGSGRRADGRGRRRFRGPRSRRRCGRGEPAVRRADAGHARRRSRGGERRRAGDDSGAPRSPHRPARAG